MSEGNEGNHKESVKAARDWTEKRVSDLQKTWLE
jgi:hypothetical protein